MPAETRKQQRFMCAVCGGKITRKRGKMPPKATACEFCKSGVKKDRKAAKGRKK